MLDHRDLWRQNWTPMAGTTEGSICWTLLNISHQIWLVVSTPLKIISQLGWLFPIYGKKTCAKPPTRNYWATQFWPIPGTPLSTSRFRDGKRFSVLAILSLHHPLVQGDVEIGAPLNHPFIDRFFHYKPCILGYGTPIYGIPQRIQNKLYVDFTIH